MTGLKVTPASHDAHDFTLTVTATSSELGGNAAVANSVSSPVSLRVTVDGVPNAPALVQTAAASGNEDSRINLNLTEALTDPNAALTLTVSGVPTGSHFYASAIGGAAIGHDNGNGSWSFTTAEVAQAQGGGLYVLPPTDWNDYNSSGQNAGMQLTATLTSTETDPDSHAVTSANTVQSFSVHVAAVADQPTVTVTPAQGNEDTAIALNITPHLNDVTNTESISAVTITGVPGGATLNHGVHNADGSWTLSSADLTGLKITPPSHSNADFTLHVTTTSTELGANASTHSATSAQVDLTVRVDGVAQAPTETVSASLNGVEDSRIAIDLNLSTFKADESLTGLTISGVPSGSHFYSTAGGASGLGTDNGNGSWSFSAGEIATIKAAGLYVQAPTDWNDYNSAGHTAGMQLTATVTASENDPDSHAVTTASTSKSFAVHVAGVADQPTVTVSAAQGNEDTAIALNITPHLTDVTNTESISAVTITGVPSGASLNHGVHNADGSWTLSSADLTGLTITPPSHSNVDFTLSVTTTSTELGSNNSVASAVSAPVSLKVTVDGLAHAPVETVSASLSGNEDSRVAIDLNLATFKADETLSGLVISSQAGANAANGTALAGSTFTTGSGAAVGTYDAAHGQWTFSASEVATIKAGGLYVQAPHDWSDWSSANNNSGLKLTATLSANETDPDTGAVTTATTSQSTAVHFNGVADTPTLTTGDVSGAQNTGSGAASNWINLSIAPQLADTDGSEAISAVTITGVPTGATLNQGTHNADGSWTLTQAQLSGLKILPNAHDAHDFTLQVTATATESGPNVATGLGSATSVQVPIHVVVEASAEAPVVSQTAASGNEDTRINVNLTLNLNDGAESFTGLTLANVPSGSHFYSAASGGVALGTDNGGGSWSFTTGEIATIKTGGLFVLPPTNWSDYDTTGHTAGMQMTAALSATKTDPESGLVHTATTSQALVVNVMSVADAPTAMTTSAAAGNEYDGSHADWIPLSISTPTLTDTDGSETLSVKITGVPTGAALNQGTANADGSWTLTSAQLSGLKVQPGAHNAADFTLTITATATEGGVASHIATATASTSSTLKVTVTGVADTPTIGQTAAAVGNEDTRINLNLTPQLADSGESLSMTLAGVPSGAAFYTAATGGSSIGTLTDAATGTWSFSKADMTAVKAAGLFVLPPSDWSDYNTVGHSTGMQLTASLTSTQIDPDTNAATTATAAPFSFGVMVKSVADTPNLTTVAASGHESDGTTPNWINLSISTSVKDSDGSESISSVSVSQVPNGAKLALADGTVLAPSSVGATTSTYTLTQGQLAGLKFQPATHDAHDVTLSITSTSTEGGVASHIATATASTTSTLKVTVDGVADTPTISQTAPAIGTEDSRIDLHLNPQLTDSGESLSMTLSGVPSGSSFYSTASGGAAIGSFNAASGTWSFSSTDMTAVKAGGLYVAPPTNWSDYNTAGHTTGMQLSAVLTSTQTDPDTGAKTTASAGALSIGVQVNAVADAPTVTVSNATVGQNDGSGASGNWVALSITPTLSDADGSETISAITISGVPAGASLNHGTDNGDGSWTLSNADLAGLKILPPAHSATDFNLTVVATATEGGDSGHIAVLNADSAAQTIKVTVTGQAEAPVVGQSAPSVGNEDSRINVNLSAALPGAGETFTGMTMTGVPAGSVFYASADAADSAKLGAYDASTGIWSFTSAEIATIKANGHGLFVQPPKDWSDYDTSGHNTGMRLVTTVNAREVDSESGAVTTASTTQTLAVEVKSVADAPSVSTSAAHGSEDAAIALNIATHLADTDGSESISAITITGVPSGASLNHGVHNADGSWTLSQADLSGLSITPPADSKTAFTLHVRAISTEGGDSAHVAVAAADSATVDLRVTVDAVADVPVVTVLDAHGSEDLWIPLSITATTPDTSGSEVVSVAITGVPAGVFLNHGSYDSASQTWTISQGDLADLKILPVKDVNADFTIHAQGFTLEPSNGDSAHSVVYDVKVVVDGTAEKPSFIESAQAIGVEDTRIDLHLTGSLTDANEALSITLSGIPNGSHFYSAASANLVNGSDATAIGTDNGDGTWSFSTAEVAAIKADGLYLKPPTDWSDWSGINHPTGAWSEWSPGQGGINVTATMTSTDTDVDTGAKTMADTQINFTVHVTGVADAAIGLPDGHFVASAVEDNNNTQAGALVDLGFGQLSVSDGDGSEHLSVVVSNLPAGTSLEFINGLSAENIVPVASGKWSVEAQYLSSLRLRVGENVNTDVTGPLHLQADVVTTEVDGNVHVDSRVVDITIAPLADAATIKGGAWGAEEAAIPLNLSVAAGGTGEVVSNITLDLSGTIAVGAVVRYDGVVVTADASGHYTLSAAEMADTSKFTLTAATNWSDWSSANHNSGIAVGVSVTSHDHNSADLVTTKTLAMHVAGVADAPTLNALGAVTIGPNQSTNVTTAAFDVAPKAALTDTDGSERLWMVVDGLPDGALLTTSTGALAGYCEGSGAWMVSPDLWDSTVASGGFKIVIPHGIADSAHAPMTSGTVTVTAVSTERDDGSMAQSSQQSFTLTWDGAGSGNGGGVTDPTAAAVSLSGANMVAGVNVGNEDSAIALNIVVDAHAGLAATLTIDADSLKGGTLSAGSYDPVHHVWVVPESAIAGLKFTPAHNWNSVNAGGDLSLGAHVAYTDPSNGGSSKVDLTIPVHVDPVTDSPNISGYGTGAEDTAISLHLADSVGATGESITQVVLSGVPVGASIVKGDGTAIAPDSAGGGTYTITGLSSAELGALKIVPPHNWSSYSGALSLDVAVTAQDHGAASLTAHKTVTVNVTGVTDPAAVSASDAHGVENHWIDLSPNLHANLTDTDGSEAISVVLANVPDGAVLNHGFNNGDGTWRLSSADLSDLKVLMPKDFNGTHDFTLQGLTWEKDGSDGLQIASADFKVTVDARAETPLVSVSSAHGVEDNAISLSISASVTHALGTDHIDHVTISGVPAGAALNHGIDNGDGSWTLTTAELGGLTITPPTHSDVGFTLRVTATAAETDSVSGATSTVTSDSVALSVKIDAVANGGTVTVANVSGNENGWIDLSGKITPHLIDSDGSESVSGILLAGLPSGAVLNHGIHNADGSWTVAPADLGSLKLQPTTNDAHDFTVSARAVSTEAANGASASGPAASFTVTVDAVAAPVNLTQSGPAAGGEDARINLNLSALVSDSNETATLTISGIPSGSAFFDTASGGSAIGHDNGDGSWTFSSTDLAAAQAGGHGLFVVPPANWSDWSSVGHTAGMQLTATVNASVTDPDTNAVSTTTSSLSFAVHVDGVADAPSVTVNQAHGGEDNWISLDISPALNDGTGSEYLSAVTISDLPAGAVLNHGVHNADGSWTLQSADLAGLQVKAASHDAHDFTVSVTATSHDWQNSGTATSDPVALKVVVDAVANAPTLTAGAAPAGVEDSRINLNLTLASTDSGESLTLSLAGVSVGSQFYSVASGGLPIGSDNGSGEWSFTSSEVAEMQTGGLFVLPPSHWSDWNTTGHSAGMQLTATLTSTATDPDSHAVTLATSSQSVGVHVSSQADAPTVTVTDATTTVDTAVALDIVAALTDVDGSESISAVSITGIPAGATLNHGVHNADGSWTLTQTELSDLKLTPASQDAHDLTLHVTAVSSEAVGGSASSATVDLHVTVNELAHAPTLIHSMESGGAEDGTINLNLTQALADPHEALSLSLAGLPADFQFVTHAGGPSVGVHHDDGNWTFTSTEIADMQAAGHGLFVQPPADWSDWNTVDHTGLQVTATLTSTTAVDPDTGLASTATSTTSFAVHVDSVADAPNLLAIGGVSTAGAITALDISSSLTDVDGSESLSLRISGLADDASLNHGVHNADGSWTLTGGDLSGLTMNSGEHDAGANTLHIEAISTESGSGSSASTVSDLVLKLSSANLGTMDQTDQHLLHFDSLPPPPVNGDQLAEFVFGSLDGIHSLDITGINSNQNLGSFSFDVGNEHVAIAAGTHGFIDGNGIHTVGENGVEAVQHIDPAAFIDTTKIHGDLTFDNAVVLHVEGLDKITF
ncbi:beta strand repeat-containing protein [Paramagnetospirillum kuznetsovii]|uniref:beta strand repeat-containing protein n=1 Tax=Paramagnetospirillum kuznetsovii TaxID=2053833 RepID=UPI0019603569|nr:hypothetical protein [Paramagnetospirillum kuznetsovii]